MVELDDVLVVEGLENLNLGHQPLLLLARQSAHLDLVPRHIPSLLLVEGHVHVFVRAAAQELGGPSEASGVVPLHEFGLRLVLVLGLGTLLVAARFARLCVVFLFRSRHGHSAVCALMQICRIPSICVFPCFPSYGWVNLRAPHVVAIITIVPLIMRGGASVPKRSVKTF